MVREKKVRRLAQLWANGTELDWKLLYTQPYPLRMSLPTYPFAKVRCWIDASIAKPQISATDKAIAALVLHPLLHNNISDFSHQSYTSVFSGKEFFLADHQIKGQKVFPAVAYLEMAHAAVTRATPEQHETPMLMLLNTAWVQPMVVSGPKQTNINLLPNENGLIDYQIVSTNEDSMVVHCEGKAEFVNLPLPGKLDIEQLNNQMTNSRMDATELYAAFNAIGTEYGNAHRVVTNIRNGELQLLAQLMLPAAMQNTLDEYILHPGIMDGALQASNVLFNQINKHADKDVLPFALESLRMVSAFKKDTFVWVRLAQGSKPHDKLIKLDIDLCDKEGNVCVQMRGFSFRMITKGPQEQNDLLNLHLATKAWQPRSVIASDVASLVGKNGSSIQEHFIFLCELPGYQIKQIEALLPGSQCLKLELKQLNIAERYSEAALLLFERIKTIFKGKLKSKVLVQLVISNKLEQTIFAGLHGLFKTASLENPNFIGQIIQIEEHATAEQLAQFLHENQAFPEETLINYIQGERNVLRWQPFEPAQEKPKNCF
ncbi:MAG: hypothetical protein HC896_03585 [Bacteroidales bacterium]|nr:hypothetical protein [Bacteroidales bacterium]